MFHWGRKILVLYLGFVAMMVFMVVMSFRQSNDLVRDDYYEAELKFQDQINAEKNASSIRDSIHVQTNGNTLTLQFPKQLAGLSGGSVYLYRASSADDDRKAELRLNDEAAQEMDISGMKKGVYTLKLSWDQGADAYYVERKIFL
ncbi:MAG: FixH family protein [Chitinophagales bacterium]